MIEKTKSSDSNESTQNAELKKSEAHIIVEIIEYIPHAVVSKTIIKKSTGNITAMSFYQGEELAEKTSPLTLIFKLYTEQHKLPLTKK